MGLRNWIDKFLDASVIFSFDQSGFNRHCTEPLPQLDLSERRGIITGASSGIGRAVAQSLVQQGMSCLLIARDLEKLKNSFPSDGSENPALLKSLDMTDLKSVYEFAKTGITTPINLLIHNAGGMPNTLTITKDGLEHMFASQVLAPFILTETLAETGKLQEGCRVIFVSSGGMYLQKLDLTDLLFKKRSYNKYAGYANAKRAQIILSEIFAKKYPQYLFSSMHPGWADTPGVSHSMPLFKKLLKHRLRTAKQGADTILWLATSNPYPSGKFWFDRKEARTSLLGFTQTTNEEIESLWKYCETTLQSIQKAV